MAASERADAVVLFFEATVPAIMYKILIILSIIDIKLKIFYTSNVSGEL
jgi:hypothetical protein